MTCREVFDTILSWGDRDEVFRVRGTEYTCDTVKAGDLDREVKKVAVAMFPTIAVIREAAAWGAELLIIHEPTYYNDAEKEEPERIRVLKSEEIRKSGLTIVRFHDFAHAMSPDLILEGELQTLGLRGQVTKHLGFGRTRFELEEPVTARELAKLIEEKLHIRHVRIAGSMDRPGKTLGLGFGAPGGVAAMLEDHDFVVVGETCEWEFAEMARDYGELGFPKALLVLGHIGSERDGMVILSDKLSRTFPELSFRYFECGEVYHYADE